MQTPVPNSPRRNVARYVAIDGFRFIAAIGVVMHHYAASAGSDFVNSLFMKNYLFVDFFFAISGFVIFYNYGAKLSSFAAYGDFLRNRIARIYPLHLLTFAIFVVLAFTIWRDKVDRSFVDSASILPNLFLVHAWGATQTEAFNYVSWSISAEWFAYLSFPLVVWLLRRGGARAAMGAAALAVLGLELAAWFGYIKPWTTVTWQFGALRALPTFLLGAALAHSVDRIGLRISSFTPAWLSFLAAVAAMMAGLDDRLILVLMMICLVVTVVAERDGAQGLLTRTGMVRLGDLSYTIYMIHPLISVLLINRVAGKILNLTGTPLVLWCAFCVVVPNLIAAWLIHRWFEKPARVWVRDLNPPAAWRSLWPVRAS